MRRLFEQAGYRVLDVKGVPGPFPLAMGDRPAVKLLVRLNKALISISRGLFSYQIFMVVQPTPTLEHLLKSAEERAAIKAAS